MSISKLPNGRWRCQVYDATTGKNVSAAKVLGLADATFSTKNEAKKIREQARAKLAEQQAERITVQAWADIWTSNRRYQRAKESTNVTNRAGIRSFVKTHGHLYLDEIDRKQVAKWLRTDGRDYQVQSLRVMFADAVDDDLIAANPFARAGVKKTKGNAEKDPPTPEEVQAMIKAGYELVSPYWGAWLTVAAYTGMRPGEVDALRWVNVDMEANRIHVREQFSSHSGELTTPKNGKTRKVVMPRMVRHALLELPQVSEFCFINLRGNHYSKSGRTYPWQAVRHTVGNRTLYLSTRHFCGWLLINVLGMDSERAAIQLGHEDGGELIRRLYGHRDRDAALDAIDQAHAELETAQENAHSPNDKADTRLWRAA